jgi:protein-disulfide isomerase
MPDRNDGGPSRKKRNRQEGDPLGEQPPSVRSRRHAPYGWAGAAAALALVTSVTAIVLTSGGSTQAEQQSSKTSALGRSIDALLDGVPQSGNALGSPSAPVTLQFFGDLECPTSREFTLEFLPSVIARWVRGGKLRIEYRSLRTATRDAEVFMAQQTAALAAGMQSKLWHYIESFYHQQGLEGSGYVTDGFLRKLAEQTPGLNFERWSGDREEPSLAAEVASDEQIAAGRGLHSTPSLLIGHTSSGPAGKPQRLLVVAPLAIDSAIEELLTSGERSAQVRGTGSNSVRRLEVSYLAGAPSEDKERTPC